MRIGESNRLVDYSLDTEHGAAGAGASPTPADGRARAEGGADLERVRRDAPPGGGAASGVDSRGASATGAGRKDGASATSGAGEIAKTRNVGALAKAPQAVPAKAPSPPSAPSPTSFLGRISGFFGTLAKGVFNLPSGVAHSLYTFAGDLVHGRLGRAARDLFAIPVNSVVSFGLHVVGAFVQLFNGGGRPPNEEEAAELRRTFGRDFDVSRLRIVENGGLLTRLDLTGLKGIPLLGPLGRIVRENNSAITIGDTIYLNPRRRVGLGAEEPKLVAHEATHTVQYARRGNAYLINAAESQQTRAGYDLIAAVRPGATYEGLNLEQQATLFEAIAYANFGDAPPNARLYLATQHADPTNPSALVRPTGEGLAKSASTTRRSEPGFVQVDITDLARSAIAARQDRSWSSMGYLPE